MAALPGDKHTFWSVGALLERVYALAGERNMALEDSFAFHSAFANLPVPGEAFGVLRGPLPGPGGIHGRLALCAERQMQLPMDLPHWLKGAGGDVGCDVAMLPAAPGAVDTPDDGERIPGPVDGRLVAAPWVPPGDRFVPRAVGRQTSPDDAAGGSVLASSSPGTPGRARAGRRVGASFIPPDPSTAGA